MKNPDQIRREFVDAATLLHGIIEGSRSVQWSYGGDNGIKLKDTHEWQKFKTALAAMRREGR